MVKEPDLKHLFYKDVERFYIPDGAQLALGEGGSPKVESRKYGINAYYCPGMQVIRLNTLGVGWRTPIPLRERDDFEAITAAMNDFADAAASLPDFANEEDAKRDFQIRFRRGRKFTDDLPDTES